jgi:Flp pilus assembly protein TadD
VKVKSGVTPKNIARRIRQAECQTDLALATLQAATWPRPDPRRADIANISRARIHLNRAANTLDPPVMGFSPETLPWWFWFDFVGICTVVVVGAVLASKAQFPLVIGLGLAAWWTTTEIVRWIIARHSAAGVTTGSTNDTQEPVDHLAIITRGDWYAKLVADADPTMSPRFESVHVDLLAAARWLAKVTNVEFIFRRAADDGDAGGMFNLATLLQNDGRSSEAETLFRRAIDAGDGSAVNSLAVLLERRGDVVEAEDLYRRAVSAGHVFASRNLAILLQQRGDIAEAETLYRRAIDAGDVPSLSGLAGLEKGRGRLMETETLYRQAVEAGSVSALNHVAILLKQRGEFMEAETLYRQAIAAGDTFALGNLAILLTQQGQTTEAIELYRRALDAGHTSAQAGLDALLAEHGRA